MRLRRSTPALDMDWQEEEAVPYKQLLAEKSFAELQDALLELPQDNRDYLYQHTSLFHRQGINRWCDAMPSSALAWCAVGYHLLHTAQLTGTDTLHAQERSLRVAARSREAFTEALLVDPFEALGYAGQILVGTTLLRDDTQAHKLYQGALLVQNDHYLSARNFLTHLSARQGGSHQVMFDHTQNLQRLPQGASARGLVAHAHVERWNHHKQVGESAYSETYFSRAAIQSELMQAADASVLHADHVLSWASRELLNTFAFGFLLGNNHAYLGRTLALLGAHATAFPWSFHEEGTGLLPRRQTSSRRKLSGGKHRGATKL